MLFLLDLLGLVFGVAISVYGLLNILLSVEVLAAKLPSAADDKSPSAGTPTFTVLVPAHNEAAGIEDTLRGLLQEISDPEQICVIADNCTDETAKLSRNLGVRVLERTNQELRGKGYALDFGLSSLIHSPPDVVVIVDADCQVGPGTLATIVKQSAAENRPVQAIYRLMPPSEASTRDRISAFALTFKNLVRAGGLSRLGCPILLGGTGMAFPWESLQSVSLASGHIVEDMKLGIDLAIVGYSPKLSTDALVTSRLPGGDTAAVSQRTRWEHGHLQTLVTYVPQIAKAAWQQRRLSLFVLGLDLAIPPLALWVMIGIALTLASGIFAVLSGIVWPVALQSLAISLLVLTVLSAWAQWGREELPLSQLLAIPLYILWKIPIYLKFILKPQTSWIRTERDT